MSACKSCGAPVKWARTEASNKPMPLDVQMVMGGNVIVVDRADTHAPIVRVLKKGEVDPERAAYQSHFVSCPERDQHRKT